MGDDEYHPISQKGINLTDAGGIGYTVVDSIDTMLLMGLNEEYERARQWVATKMDLDRDANFNTFEVRLVLLAPVMVHDFGAHDVCVADNYPSVGWATLRVPLFQRLAVPRQSRRARGPHHARIQHAVGPPTLTNQSREA